MRWLTEYSQAFLDDGYLLPGQTVQDAVWLKAMAAEKILGKPDFAKKFYDYFERGWYSFSTPVWTNFGTDRGLPISCFGATVYDNMPSILSVASEVGMETKYGGGTSGYFGNLRPRGSTIRNNGTSAGSVHFMQLFDTMANIVSQGSTRRGSFAAYLDANHKDIFEFLAIQSEGHPIQKMHFGVCIPEGWMQSMIGGDEYKRKVWAKIIESRLHKAEPYIVFLDNVNNNTVDVYKDKGMRITHSNLCTEILLPDNDLESFVCDLGSMNLFYYDEWKDTDAVETKIYFLDSVMTEFIQKAKNLPGMERPVRFAERHRALGLGVFGWHSYLQANMIPYESMEAKYKNVEIFKLIQAKSYEASRQLAIEYGEPEILKGYGRRNTTTMAPAPTTSSAFIIGQASTSTEPWMDNYFTQNLAKGKFSVKNPQLEKVLDKKGKNDYNTWMSILKNKGGVQHLDFLDDHEKAVFKTLAEISQKEIIIQAAQRQPYIDQGQSTNLFIHPSTPAKLISKLYIEAWELGCKTLYYQYGKNSAKEFADNLLVCKNCEA
jgi:ribonucleoside-diphosphate reductase alpha chain